MKSLETKILIDFINLVDDSTKLQIISPNYYILIKFIKNPSEIVQLKAVKQNVFAIRYIQNPTDKVQFLAINLIKNSANIDFFAKGCFDKISNSIYLHTLHNYVSNPFLKQKIRKSKYWKNDSNLILEFIKKN